jgi:hypothetical protein
MFKLVPKTCWAQCRCWVIPARSSAFFSGLCPISFGSLVFKLGAKTSDGHQCTQSERSLRFTELSHWCISFPRKFLILTLLLHSGSNFNKKSVMINSDTMTNFTWISYEVARIFFLSPSTCRNFFSSPTPCMNFFLDLPPPPPPSQDI